jgi:hypothetical protein
MLCAHAREPMPGGWPAFHLARHRAAKLGQPLSCPAPSQAPVSEELSRAAQPEESWDAD